MLRIGQIEYANCTPIFHALRELSPVGDYQYVEGVPARLNSLLSAGDIDVCPSSSIEYALHPERYLIIPEISISSRGPVQSVLLFSNLPIEKLDGRDILLTSESATSVNLLKILIKERYGCSCFFNVSNIDLNAALKSASAVLLIGDTALKAAMRAQDIYIYDLGELWHAWTGTPFVFALWLVSRKSMEKHEAELFELADRLQCSKTFAFANLESIADKSRDAVWMGRDRLLEYWRENISYDLGRDHCIGLNRFYLLAAEAGLIENAPALAFLGLDK